LIYVAATIFAFIPMAGWMIDGRTVWPLSPAPVYQWMSQDQSSFWKVNLLDLAISIGNTKIPIPFLVDFRTPDDQQHPWSSAGIIGITFLIVFLLYLLM